MRRVFRNGWRVGRMRRLGRQGRSLGMLVRIKRAIRAVEEFLGCEEASTDIVDPERVLRGWR